MHRAYALACVLFLAWLTAASAAPPFVASHCSSDNGATWQPCPPPGGGTVTIAPISPTAPTGGVYAVTNSAGTAIGASSSRKRLSYQLQGAGTVCASWATASVGISGTGNPGATCTGNGAFVLTAGQAVNLPQSSVQILPSSALTVIGGTDCTSCQLVWDAQ